MGGELVPRMMVRLTPLWRLNHEGHDWQKGGHDPNF